MRIGVTPALLLTIPLLATAFAAPPAADATAARSHDGLYAVRNTGSTSVWARPDIDLTAYDALLAELGDIRYALDIGNRRHGDAFPINAATRQRVASLAADAFREALAEVDGFSLAATPGPGVLIVRGTLVEVAPAVTTELQPLGEVVIGELDEATLVIELVDSESRAVLLRAVETRRAQAATDPAGAAVGAQRPQLEGMLKAWGLALKEALEQLHDRFTISRAAP